MKRVKCSYDEAYNDMQAGKTCLCFKNSGWAEHRMTGRQHWEHFWEGWMIVDLSEVRFSDMKWMREIND